jgi:hypothetical protein
MNRLPWGRLILLGVCAALLVAPATALGQDALSNPSAAQYTPQSQIEGTNINGPTASNSTGAPVARNDNGPGTLPFTGMDLAVVAGAAVLMIAAGFTLRRLSAPRTPGI